MRILLDTHVILWWDNEPDKLSASARAVMEDQGNDLLLSLASVWEMQIKKQLGKLTLRLPLAQLIGDQRTTNGIELLPVSLEHILALDKLPPVHKDPFERLLIAQAYSERITILTADPVFDDYHVTLAR